MTALGQTPNSNDFILQYYPNLAFLARNLRAGILPLWNPTLFAGTPYLADPQSQLLYFPNWPFLVLLGTTDAARAIILAHLALAAVSTYGYLRHLRLHAMPSIFGAVIYGLGPYAIAQVAWPPMLISMAWMPLALLLFERSLERRSLLWAALSGAVLTLQFFNGYPHGSYITAYALLAIFLWHAAAAVISARNWHPLAPLTALAATAIGTFLGLTAPVLLPFAEFTLRSNYVTDRAADEASSVGSVTLLTLLGNGGTEGHAAYLGIVGLLMMLVGVLYGTDRRRMLHAAIACFALLVAFGANAPVYGFLHGWVPGFRTFHVPGRFVVLFLFAAAVLAAKGTEAILRRSGRRLAVSTIISACFLAIPGSYLLVRMLGPDSPARLVSNLLNPEAGPYLSNAAAVHVIIAGTASAVFLAILATNKLPGRAVVAIALALLVVDLFHFQGNDTNYFSPPPAILRSASPAPVIVQLAREPEFRVAGFQQTGLMHFLSDFPLNLNPGLVPPNFSLQYGLEDLEGYQPLRLRSYADYLEAINGGGDDYHWALLRNLQSPLLDMLNLRYVMIRDNQDRLQNVTIATNLAVSPSQPGTVRPVPIEANAIQVNSYVGNSAGLPDGQVVATIKVTATSGEVRSFDLRLGKDTADWAYDRPEVTPVVKHKRAQVAMTRNLPASTHVYRANYAFPNPVTISEISVQQVEPSIFVDIAEIIAVPAHPVERYEKVGELDGATLYRNHLALPRALMVPASESVDSWREAMQKIQSPDFQPQQKVILQGDDAPTVEATGASTTGDAVIQSRNPNNVRLSVNAASSGFLLLNELSYPGWNAYLDGHQVKVWRANFLFRAIEVPPGQHDVEFRFEPDSLKLGLAISASTLALLLVATAILRLKFRNQKEITVP